jgi:hypothetical protein
VKFCPECGYRLASGTEKYRPECGIKLQAGSSGKDDNASSTGITNTKGDVFGAGFTGSGNITGKEIGYTLLDTR